MQQQYLFLYRNGVTNVVELAAKQLSLNDKKKEVSSQRSRIYKERAGFKPLFDKLTQIEELESAANSYQKGDDFFQEEYEMCIRLKEELKKEGYTKEEVMQLKEHFKAEIALLNEKEKVIRKESSIANFYKISNLRIAYFIKRSAKDAHSRIRYSSVYGRMHSARELPEQTHCILTKAE